MLRFGEGWDSNPDWVGGNGLGKRGEGVKGGKLRMVQVNSEQVSLLSVVEAGERFCCPDISQELIPPLQCQCREELRHGRVMFASY